ncbi:pseudouridine synthase [Hymenobacter sp. HMF4947]|uniref:Pseudouridine synthase n=1 Tax=Hymenobacter ginkgonis TaxID=2682976 RepID=A0A7K1TD48_9BACT|nr:pseudouridine synthase [Hymenobacter ginkgonis]MVN76252.1 pseudouridine synthase [Hymenobacter ginkgonis]
MGKQHFSNDKPARRNSGSGAGRAGNGDRGGYDSRGNGSSRPGGRGEGYLPARPTFGQGGSKFGGRPGGDRPNRPNFGGGGSDRPNRGGFGDGEKRSFGGDRNDRPNRGGFGGGSGDRPNRPGFAGPGGDRSERPSRGGFGGGEKRSYGGDDRSAGRGGFGGEKRSFGGDRSERPTRGGFGDGEKRSFGGDRDARPRRFEPSEGGERPNRDERGERPAYPPKPIWQGQPVRYEGKPTVPRGTAGERNRKFIKRNPDGSVVEGSASPAPASDRPAYTGRDERRAFEERGERPTPRPRPEGGFDRRSEGGRSSYGGAGDSRPARRESEDRGERRSFSAPREGSDRRESSDRAPRKFDGDRDRNAPRAAGSFDKPRSYGERPANTGGTFRERREAMRAQMSGPRSSTAYGRSTEPGQAPDYKNLKHYEEDKNRGNKNRRDQEDFGTEELRLNRYIANAGICSRREADSLIAAGEIRVNGEVVTEMGYKVQPTDTVQYGKTNLNREKLVYVLLNKPKDFITTTEDPEGRKTVMSLVATASKERIFPVGRLDRNTTGLLLFTNDGEVAQKLSHPSHKNKKIYQAELDKPLTAEHLAEITAGVELEDGKAEVDDVAVVAGNPHFVGIELHIGRNRIVRRIFEHLGYDVVALDRVQYAGLTKKDLPRGKWRFLSEQEVIRLKYFMK